jgi:anthranilate phosphoribosyltransferase
MRPKTREKQPAPGLDGGRCGPLDWSLMDLLSLIGRAAGGENLSFDEMAAAIGLMVSGESTEGEVASLLMALRAKGETIDEVAGAAFALRHHMTPIRSHRDNLLDTCGTGGDGSRTFNISTASAIVTAAADVPVAKHGNRSISSRTGSADALAALGVNIDAGVPQVERCLEELGICFCFAPLLHQSVKHVSAVRKKLGVPTIFNLLGPLTNPAGAPYQVLGVGRAELRPLLAAALARLGTKRAVVVHGDDGIDEVSLAGPTQVTLVEQDRLQEFTWTPADFGLSPADRSSMLVDNPAESAAIIRRVLSGEPGPSRDIVVLNAAAALWTAGKAAAPSACARLASAAIDSGAAQQLLCRLAALSHE